MISFHYELPSIAHDLFLVQWIVSSFRIETIPFCIKENYNTYIFIYYLLANVRKFLCVCVCVYLNLETGSSFSINHSER